MQKIVPSLRPCFFNTCRFSSFILSSPFLPFLSALPCSPVTHSLSCALLLKRMDSSRFPPLYRHGSLSFSLIPFSCKLQCAACRLWEAYKTPSKPISLRSVYTVGAVIRAVPVPECVFLETNIARLDEFLSSPNLLSRQGFN